MATTAISTTIAGAAYFNKPGGIGHLGAPDCPGFRLWQSVCTVTHIGALSRPVPGTRGTMARLPEGMGDWLQSTPEEIEDDIRRALHEHEPLGPEEPR